MMLLVAMAIFVVFAILSVPFIYLCGYLLYKGSRPTGRLMVTCLTALSHR